MEFSLYLKVTRSKLPFSRISHSKLAIKSVAAKERKTVSMENLNTNSSTAAATTTTTTISANGNPSSSNDPILSPSPVWPTVDGPLGLSEEESLNHARRFYKFGYALLPWLWAVNCFYFWPVLRHSRSFPRIRPYVIRSAVGFTAFSALLFSWALTFAIGGEQLFGPVWDKLVMYNVADKLGLTGWI